ncbi:MAG: prepilin-type N-terminal cleavage/methylation domain-containing protein [Deltaproteobacteria bacterium]|nr:prepilin-type N-terminal cleavage/methylation domain-containing protein [Deltaproteobacteria bacterium]
MNRQKGFTIVELLIAIFITGIISAAVYSMYTTFFSQSSNQDQSVEAQQNARVALNLMERELMNAGYAANTDHVITEATASSIMFKYSDPNTTGNNLEVRYGLQTTGGVQYLVRRENNLTTGTTGDNEDVAQYVETLAFTYFDINGNQIADTSTEANRDAIKFLTVNIVTRTKDNIQGTTAPGTFMLETHIRIRNIGVGQASNDSSPPSAPADVQVRDPGLCSRLKVKWLKSPEGDVAGYKVYYGVSSGTYSGVITIPLTVMSGSQYSCSDAGSSIECTIVPSNTVVDGGGTTTQVQALAHTPSDGSSTTTYYVAVKSYDNSLNASSFSSEVSGNPGTSNSVFDTGVDDSTINPVKPAAVAGFTAADGPADGQVALSWTAYNTSSNPDVVGFRVYRSTSPFTSYPIDPTASGIDWVAGEPGSGKPELAQGATSYTDSGSLIGCRTYYYAIAPVNCDATLVPDNGGDPVSKKYVQTDYDATCGNGSTACSPGTGFAAETGSDTAPDKTTSPSAPTIDARAGWKRVALSLTQPADADLNQTCVYVNDSATYPALLTDTDSYPKVSGCLQVNMTSTPTAQLIPDSDGIFTSAELAAAASTSFWHDSWTDATPPGGIPSLAEIGTYSYRAISFDLCGNGSSVSAAQATTILCGEDPASGEKPPAVAGASASCCSSPVTLSWTQVPSDTSLPSSAANPYDLAGYRIFRSTSVDFSASSMVSGSAPFWGASFSDTTATEGGTYYYRIVSTDCPYERTNPSEAAIRGNMLSGYLNSVMVGPVRPGRIDRDEKCPGAGSCAKDDHRQVLTGVDMNNTSGTGDGTSTIDADFTHHKVTMFAHNTSSGTMTVTGVTVNWINSAANLVDVRIGGGRSGVGTFTTSIDPGLTAAVSGNPPYTRGVSSVALTPVTIPAGARYVPIRFRFKDASDNEVDMRDDQLLVTLNVTNDATSTTSCVSYMTVSTSLEGVYVPFGPSVTATQQNKPSSPTFSYAVPGVTGLNVVASGVDGPISVDSGLTVTVSANIAGNTTDETTGGKVPVSSATLYYRTTAKTTTTAPSSGYTAAAMTNTGGNIWSASIPTSDGYRVWYYIVAVDSDGNWDRDPEADRGSYVYDQKDFSICEVTPSAPASLAATQSGSDALLTWSPVTTYTNGNTLGGTDSITYRIYRGSTQIGTDQAGTTYTDASLASGVYSYTVKALNACASPGPKVSALSNTAATCVGANSQATLTVSPSTIYRGGSYTVNIVDCLAMRNDAPYTYGTTVESINSTVSFTGHTNTSGSTGYQYNPVIPETGAATGTFTATITTTSDVTQTATKLYVGASDTISVFYPYASTATRTVNVIVDPCINTPKKPTGLTGSTSGNNMTLSWAAVTQNTDNSAIADLAGYKVYEKVCAKNKPNCTGADIVADWFQRTSVGPGTTSVTVSDDQGVLSQRIYYFKVSAYDSCGAPNESALSDPWNE